MLDWRFAKGPVTTEKVLSHSPGHLRILAIDGGLPMPLDLCTLPFVVRDRDLDGMHFDRDWLAHLKLRADEKAPDQD